MKVLISIILTVAIASFQLSEVVIFISFKINQEYIAKNLCVEKDIVNSSCKGCCQLKKRVSENKEQKKEAAPIQNKLDINFISPETNSSAAVYQDIHELVALHICGYTFAIDKSFFHPPELLTILS